MVRRSRKGLRAATSLAAILAAAGSWAAEGCDVGTTAGQAVGAVGILAVAPSLYMLTVGGINVAVQTGPDGTVVVDTGAAGDAPCLLAAIKKIAPDAPISFVIDTNADAELIGGSGILAAAGRSLAQMDFFINVTTRAATGQIAAAAESQGADIIARQGIEELILQQQGGESTDGALPTEVFARPQLNFILNGEPIEVVAVPAAHSEADSVVRFNRQDVVVSGAVFDQTRFPMIDVAQGGSIQGEINALNTLANSLVFEQVPILATTGGTLIIPVRGPVSDQSDLINYRDMVATIRDRVQYDINHGMNLKQTEAADPAQGYTSRYGSVTGSWTTTDFIGAVYRSLVAARNARRGEKK